MLEDIEFPEFWIANYPNLGTNQPLIMVQAFMEVGYKAWLAGKELGFDEGKATSQAITNDVLNFGKHKNKRS